MKITDNQIFIANQNANTDWDTCPLPLEVIPNYMGINLCSVDSIKWGRQEDGQLTYLTIYFTPNNEETK